MQSELPMNSYFPSWYGPYGVFYSLQLIRIVGCNKTGPFSRSALLASLIGGLPGVDLWPLRVQSCRHDSCADSRLSFLYLFQSSYVYTPSWDIFTQCLRGYAITLRGALHFGQRKRPICHDNTVTCHSGMPALSRACWQSALERVKLLCCSLTHLFIVANCLYHKTSSSFHRLAWVKASDCENYQVDHAEETNCAIFYT